VTRFHFERILEKEEKKKDENVLLGSVSSFFLLDGEMLEDIL
jgi:hypothetical protein